MRVVTRHKTPPPQYPKRVVRHWTSAKYFGGIIITIGLFIFRSRRAFWKVSANTTKAMIKHHQLKPDNKKVVRLVVISDTHGHHELLSPLLPPGDILIHCGDFCNKGSIQDAKRFAQWFERQTKYAERFVINGNHDRNRYNPSAMDLTNLFAVAAGGGGAAASSSTSRSGVRLLQDESLISRDGLVLHGASWETCESGDFFARESLTESPLPIDILLAHVNPYLRKNVTIPQVGRTAYRGWKGSRALSNVALEQQIPLVLGGHTHYGRGVVNVKTKTQNQSHRGDNDAQQQQRSRTTTFVNAASLWPKRWGVGVSRPIVIDFDVSQRKVIQIDYQRHG